VQSQQTRLFSVDPATGDSGVDAMISGLYRPAPNLLSLFFRVNE